MASDHRNLKWHIFLEEGGTGKELEHKMAGSHMFREEKHGGSGEERPRRHFTLQ